MDSSNSFMTQGVRYDHLQRILKQYELEALNSLRGPATLSGAADLISGSSSAALNASYQQQAQSQIGVTAMATSEAEKTALSSLLSAASVLYGQNKALDHGISSVASSTSRRNEVSNAAEERSLNVDRSVLQQQETLLKEILTLRGAIPVQPLPVLTAQDRTSGAAERKDTLLEGEVITCFVVGGEKRLCLPQVLNSVLKNVSMVDINRACSELNIHCGHATPEQLLVLKIAGVVSATTASCALITKTDAERLCDNLLRQKRKDYRPTPSHRIRVDPFASVHHHSSSTGAIPEAARSNQFSSQKSESEVQNGKTDREISVIHYCFGRCRGSYRPSLYASPSAECIECNECGQMFAPDRFVVHSHGNQERRTCHWGFDSANWRAYLQLTDEDECEENTKILDEMKLRFDVNGLTKRKLDVNADSETRQLAEVDGLPSSAKRLRMDVGERNRSIPQPAPVSTSQRETNHKAVASTGAIPAPISLLPGLDQANLPYLLCDPLLLAVYYQAAFAAATARTTTIPQSTAVTANVISPFLLPQLITTAPALQAPQKQQLAVAAANPAPDGFGSKVGKQMMRERPLLDEATAAAALKLLQLHAGGSEDINIGKLLGPQDIQKPGHVNSDGCDRGEKLALFSPEKSFVQQPQYPSSSFGKEPFKKQLLHLFTAEQQQKEKQRQQELPNDSDLGQRGSVEIVVDDNEPEIPTAVARQLHQSLSESEKMNGNANTPETQVADELSISSSDNEGANGEPSLDELLHRYIFDSDGLRLVRAKIAENQSFLEQKLDAVSAENRLLHAECLQLRTKEIHKRQQQEQQEHAAMAANLLSKGAIGNLVGFLPKQFTL